MTSLGDKFLSSNIILGNHGNIWGVIGRNIVMQQITTNLLIIKHNSTGYLSQACLFTFPRFLSSQFVPWSQNYTQLAWRHLNFWLQVQPVWTLPLWFYENENHHVRLIFQMKMDLSGEELFPLRSKYYIYAAMVKIRQFLPLLFIVIFLITANQQLSSLLLCKATQALGVNIWDVVSERGIEILHSFIAPAALRQAAASSSLCSITYL